MNKDVSHISTTSTPMPVAGMRSPLRQVGGRCHASCYLSLLEALPANQARGTLGDFSADDERLVRDDEKPVFRQQSDESASVSLIAPPATNSGLTHTATYCRRSPVGLLRFY